jgi:hypothetical protein
VHVSVASPSPGNWFADHPVRGAFIDLTGVYATGFGAFAVALNFILNDGLSL